MPDVFDLKLSDGERVLLVEPQIVSRETTARGITRSEIVMSVIGLIACLFGIWIAAHDGLSRLSAETAKTESSLTSAEEAIRLSPSDPEAHYASAFVLESMGNFADAADEYERAIALRRGDYVLWAG